MSDLTNAHVFVSDINECESNPCINNGHCVDNVLSYSCVCAPGYTGVTCNTGVVNCISESLQCSTDFFLVFC